MTLEREKEARNEAAESADDRKHPFRIRPYQEDDYAACAQLWEIAKLRVHTPAQMAKLLAGAGGALVAETEDDSGDSHVVGVLLWSHNGDIAILWRLTVAPPQRGRGIARALVRRAEQDVLAEGFEGMCLITRRTNEAARALYTSEGYSHKEIHEFWGKKLI